MSKCITLFMNYDDMALVLLEMLTENQKDLHHTP
jgi:hypothetical protein